MSEEKERDDTARANELLALLKKYWKIEEESGNGSKGKKATFPQVKSDLDRASVENEEPPLYDGIISEATEGEKKKKYSGIPDDEPLFVFDSFESGDDAEDKEILDAPENNGEDEEALDAPEIDSENEEALDAPVIDGEDEETLDTPELDGDIDEEFDGDIDEEFDEDVDEEFDEDVDEELGGDIDEELDGDVDEEFDGDVDEELDEDVDEELDEDIDEELDEDIDEELDGDVDEEFDGDVNEELDEDVDEELDEDVDEELDEDIDIDDIDDDVDGDLTLEDEKPIVTKPVGEAAESRFKGLFGARRGTFSVRADGGGVTEDETLSADKTLSDEVPADTVEAAASDVFDIMADDIDDIDDTDDDDGEIAIADEIPDIPDVPEAPEIPDALAEVCSEESREDEVLTEKALTEEALSEVPSAEEPLDKAPPVVKEPVRENVLPVVEMYCDVGDDTDIDHGYEHAYYYGESEVPSNDVDGDVDGDGECEVAREYPEDAPAIELDGTDDVSETSSDDVDDGVEQLEFTDEASELEDTDEIFSDDDVDADEDGISELDGIDEAEETEGFDEAEGEPEIADEVEELCLAEEITSETPTAETVPLTEEKATPYPDWLPDEGYLRECAQLELPKLSVASRPITEDVSDVIPDAVSSGYVYAEPEPELPKELCDLDGEEYKEKSDAYYHEKTVERRSRQRKLLSAVHRDTLYCFILSCVTLLFEGLGYLFDGGNMLSGAHGRLIFAFDVILTVLCAFVARELFCELFSSLKGHSAVPAECIGCIPCVAVLVYDAVAVLALGGSVKELRMLGACASVCTLLCLVARCVRMSQDARTFELSSRPVKHSTLVELEKNSAVPEYREFSGMLREDAPIYCVNEVERLASVYGDVPKRGKKSVYLPVFLTVCSVLAIGIGVFGYIRSASLFEGIWACFAALLAMLPCGFAAATVSLRGRMLSRAAACGAVITDDGAPSRLVSGVAVMIRDTELFPVGNVSVKGYDMAIETPDGTNESISLERALSHVVSLFHKLGGTLGCVFSMVEKDLEPSEDVIFTDISEKGVSALVEGTYVRIGSAAYLGRYGIPVISDNTERAANERVLYVSDNGAFCTKIVLSFKADKLLCKRIRKLRRDGVAVSLKTCDPCIDAALVLATAGLEPELLKVIRYNVADDITQENSRREGGISSSDGVRGIFSALGACFRANRATRLSRVLSAALSALGAVALTLGYPLLSGKLAVLIGAYQLLCFVGCAIASRMR